MEALENAVKDDVKSLEFSGYVYNIYSSLNNFNYDHAVYIVEQVYNASRELNSMLRGLNAIVERSGGPTKLQKLRKICGYSQSELATKAGVNLRTLQQYETRVKDINKASVKTVEALATVLGCRIEDLLE